MNITVARFLLENNVYKDCGMVRIPTVYYDQIMDALKEPEAVKPRILYTVERHCGYCDKILEDEWITCPWCGIPVSFKVCEAK